VANSPVDIEIEDNAVVAELLGPYSRNLADLERAFEVQIYQRGNILSITGEAEETKMATNAIRRLEKRLKQGRSLESGDVHGAIRLARGIPAPAQSGDTAPRKSKLEFHTRKRVIEPRSATQRDYIAALTENNLTFGVGPAACGRSGRTFGILARRYERKNRPLFAPAL